MHCSLEPSICKVLIKGGIAMTVGERLYTINWNFVDIEDDLLIRIGVRIY
jgi:hypothetical protein